ncbi:MAG: alpha/beta hydrolase [Myxococcota bacterium]
MVDSPPQLPDAVSAPREQIDGRAGPLSYYVAGVGKPLLLLHSINAAASAYEMRPLFEGLRQRFRVFLPDLPGFGFSDRSRRYYDPRLYTDAVHDMLNAIEASGETSPVRAVALSLSSEFLARAVTERPDRFDNVCLITPTGFTRGSDRLREAGKTRELPGFAAVFEFPLWRRAMFRLLTRRSVIRYFLRRTYGRSEVDEDMVDYDYLTAHQPGAENAPFAFLSGRLFSRDIRDVYERLQLRVWVPHATRGDFKDFRGAQWTHDRPNWRVEPFDSGALVHYEQPEMFLKSYLDFAEGSA